MKKPSAPRSANRPGSHRWRRESVELAAVFAAAAITDLVANVVVHGREGPVLLAASALALIATAAFHVWWTHRTTHGPPGPGEPAGFEHTALWRLRTTVADSPGSLARVCAALAERRVNIVSMQAHPLESGAVDEFLIRAPATVDRAELTEAVATAGGHDIWTDRADAHDLVDVPTHVLSLATRTALDAAELPIALRQLFGRCAIRQYPGEAERGPAGIDGHVLRLPGPSGDLIELTRPHFPFTPTEFARAQALVRLDSLLGPRVPKVAASVSVEAGPDLTVRRAGPADRPAVLAMHGRCSPNSLRKRYREAVKGADRYLNHLLDPHHGQTLAVEAPDGRIVALAHLMWDGDGAEVTLLVEDTWQRQGLGLDLLRRMAALALEAGVPTVYAVTHSSNTGLVATMRGLGVPLDFQAETDTLVVTAHLAPASGLLPEPWPAGPQR